MGVWYKPSQKEIDAVKQYSKDIYVKVELLSRELKVQGTIEGNMVSDNFTIDSESKQRRTYSCELCVTDSTFLVGEDKKIWIDKYIRVYYGIKSLRTKEVIWWLLGTFTYLNANYRYSSTENNLSLSCADMMANFDGTKNGQIVVERVTDYSTAETYNSTTGYKFVINQGEKIKKAIISLVKNAGIKSYQIEDYPIDRDIIPYDLEYTNSLTYNDVWNDICELYPGWEYFFDEYGKFIWRRIPSGGSGSDNERIVLDNTLIDPLIVDESISDNFTGIYNVTEVWGQMLELDSKGDRYTNTSTYDSSTNTYSIHLNLIPKSGKTQEDWNKIETFFDHLDRIAFMVKSTNNAANPKVKITGDVIGSDNQVIGHASLPAMTIVRDGGAILAKNYLLSDIDANQTIYVFTYRNEYTKENGVGKWINVLSLNGKTQCFGRYEEKSKDCPFSTTRLGYQIVQRKNFDKLIADDLCYNQAQYETYKASQMMETIDLTMIIIPWLDVNQKVAYVMQNAENRGSQLANKNKIPQYIIKNISWNTFDGTMKLTMYRFQKDLEFVKKKK